MQIQLATTVYNLQESHRSQAELQAAAEGLEQAIESLDAIAQHPQTPYPKHDVEQRANMARNTMRKQLERSIQGQKEYEEKNAEKLLAAKQARDLELKKRNEAKVAAEAELLSKKQKIAEERQKIAERDRELAEIRQREEREREEKDMTTDSETGDKVKRRKKTGAKGAGGKRKKKNEEGITDDDDSGAEPQRRNRGGSGRESDEEKPKPKKRRLGKKSQEKPNKYKSSEIVVDSDSEGDNGAAEAAKEMDVADDEPTMDVDVQSDEEATPARAASKRKSRRTMIDSDDEDEEEAAPAPAKEDSPATANGETADTPMADSDDE